MARASLADLQDALKRASRQIARYREAGNAEMEINWRREFQRISGLYAQAVAGQAIQDSQLTPGEWAKATVVQAGQNLLGVGRLAATGAVLFLAVMALQRLEPS